MIPKSSKKRSGAISANSTSAVPRWSRRNPRRPWGRGSRSGACPVTGGPLRAPSTTRSPFYSGLQVVVDLVEDRRDVRAEQAEDAHSRDRDECQDERILHHRLTLFAIAKGREREVHPHRDHFRPL